MTPQRLRHLAPLLSLAVALLSLWGCGEPVPGRYTLDKEAAVASMQRGVREAIAKEGGAGKPPEAELQRMAREMTDHLGRQGLLDVTLVLYEDASATMEYARPQDMPWQAKQVLERIRWTYAVSGSRFTLTASMGGESKSVDGTIAGGIITLRQKPEGAPFEVEMVYRKTHG
jgi:hypothetical protein